MHNAGAMRENITGGSSSAVAGVAFKNDIAIGDRFFTLPFSVLKAQTVKLVATALTEVDASAAVATNEVAYQPIEIKLGQPPTEILTDTGLRERLSAGAVEFVKKLSPEKIATEWEGVYADAIEKKSAR